MVKMPRPRADVAGDRAMEDKEAARKRLARAHYELEPGITEIFTIWGDRAYEALPGEPIKLLEVNRDTIPSGIMPLGFNPAPASGFPFPSVIIEVTPQELERIRRQELVLPHGWTLGPLIPRTDSDNGQGTSVEGRLKDRLAS